MSSLPARFLHTAGAQTDSRRMNERTHARMHRGLRPGNADPLTRLHVSRQPALSISMVPPAPASQAWPGSSQSVLRWLLGPQLLSTCDRGETGCALAARAAQPAPRPARSTAQPARPVPTLPTGNWTPDWTATRTEDAAKEKERTSIRKRAGALRFHGCPQNS